MEDDTTLDFKRLFQFSPDLYLVLTPGFVIAFTNEAYTSATKIRQKDVVGRYMFDMFPDDPDDALADGVRNLKVSLERVLKTRQPDSMPVQKYPIRRPDSEGGGFEERYWSPRNSPVLDAKGEVIYIIHRVEDVTAFINLSARIVSGRAAVGQLMTEDAGFESEIYRRAQEVGETARLIEKAHDEAVQKLQKSNAELEQFAYVASHDLKAPLRAVSSLTKWIEEDLGADCPEKVRENMALMRKRITRMEKLLNDLLEYSRIGSKHWKAVPELVRGRELVEDTLFLVAPPHGMRVVIGDGFTDVRLARTPLQQVLFNLINNAVKHHDKPDGIIEVLLRDENSKYRITVKDDGPGISAQNHGRIFEMFQTLKPRDEKEGSGMGLAVVKKILALYGSDVTIVSHPGDGAEFSFDWPKDSKEVTA